MNKWTRRFEDDRAADRVSTSPIRQHYFAFLSYSHQDSEEADWLHEELEGFRVPSALVGKLTYNGSIPSRLTPIFRDRHELAASDSLTDEIQAALAVSRCLIVLCSPAAAKSKWTNDEIETFRRLHPQGAVIAAVIGGEPLASDLPGREDEECFPPALVTKYDRRGNPTKQKIEPLAADLREGHGGRREGFLKIVAGLLGVGLDELIQRDTVRRQRRLAWLAAASLAGMAVTSTLAITAIQARNAAREQRHQAESLIEFMVGDLRDKLEPIGKLDVLDGVGSRVLSYYSKQDTSELSDDALIQRSRALNLLAEVAFNRGNMQEAEGLYRQAMAGTAEGVRRSPDNAQRIFDHAQNVFWVGEVARFTGRPAEAEGAYREYQRLADQMSALQPDNLKYRMEVLYANEDVGISLYNQHRFAEAERAFEGIVGPMQNLASLYPADTTYRKEFSTLLAWVADAQRSQGNFKAAIAAHERQVAALSELLGTETDSDARSRLITAHEGLGLALADDGQSKRAITELQSSVREAEDLIPVEPLNALWKSMASDARLALAVTLLSLGRNDEAAQHTAAGCTLAAELPPSYAGARSRLGMNCAMMRSRLALASGATADARSYAARALAAARTRHSEDPIADRYLMARVYRLLGDAKSKAGDVDAARAAWTSGLAQLPANASERPSEMNDRLQLLRRLNRTAEAAPLAAKLNAIGYRNRA